MSSKLVFKVKEKKFISAFAFNVGQLIEELIEEETNNLRERNQLTEAKVLGFFQKLEEPLKTEYAEYFGIEIQEEGKL